jgi:hypothetical protein
MEAPKPQVKTVGNDPKWAQMTGAKRTIFVLKVIVMVCSGGFIFSRVI